MSALVFNAVVGRIVNFPIRGVAARGEALGRKALLQVNNPCDITWGYVAWIGRGWGRGQILKGVRGAGA